MNTAIEVQIGDLLNAGSQQDAVAVNLIDRWEKNLLSEDEQGTVAQFLFTSGQYQHLLDQSLRLLREGKLLPWAHLAQCLVASKLKLTSNHENALLDGIRDQRAMFDAMRAKDLELLNPEFAPERERYMIHQGVIAAQKRTDFTTRLQYVRSQRLLDEEAKILHELHATFPNDPIVNTQQREYDERWARDVIAQATQPSNNDSENLGEHKALDGDQADFKMLLINQLSERAAMNPKLTYDLAIVLHFMDFHSEAVQLLTLAPPSPQADWLGLELLLKARRFVDALERAQQLEIQYAEDAESSFAALYARARALWGLGQKSMAIDLMRGIVNVRPGYKGAHSLLTAWGGGSQ